MFYEYGPRCRTVQGWGGPRPQTVPGPDRQSPHHQPRVPRQPLSQPHIQETQAHQQAQGGFSLLEGREYISVWQ